MPITLTVAEDWREDARKAIDGHLPPEDVQTILQHIEAAYAKGIAQSDEPRWDWRTMLHAYMDRPPIAYVVDGLIAEGTVNIVFGSPGCLKSMLVNDLIMCIASGEPWLGPLPGKTDCTPLQTRQCAVSWIDVDNGTRRTDERMEAIGRAHGISSNAPVYYLSIPVPAIIASDENTMDALANDLRLLGIKVIVLDNLGTIKGMAKENTDEMVPVMANIRRLAEKTGAAVILLHHQRKAQPGASTRDGDSVRGHSSIEASIDLALRVDREPDSATITVRATKVRGADVPPFAAMFTYEWKEGTKDLDRARFWGTALQDDSSPFAVKRSIVDLVRDLPGINKGDLTERIKEEYEKAGVNMIRRYIGELVTAGKLVEDGQWKTKRYTLPE